MSVISTPGASGALSGVTVSGIAASGQVPVASSATAGAWKYPPGYEIGYDQIASPVNIVSTTEATGTTIITSSAYTFDGNPVIAELFALVRVDTAAAGDAVVLSLFESSTQITRLAQCTTVITTNATVYTVLARYRFTPTAASHTYTTTAFTTSTTGTPSVRAGSGGTGGISPCYMRFTKV